MTWPTGPRGKAAERVHAFGPRLARVAGGKDVIAHHQQHAASGRFRIGCNPNGVGKIAHSVAAHRIGGTHCANQDHRLGSRQGLIEQERGFFRSVRPVGDDDPEAVVLRRCSHAGAVELVP